VRWPGDQPFTLSQHSSQAKNIALHTKSTAMSFSLTPEEQAYFDAAKARHTKNPKEFGCAPDQMLHMLQFILWGCRGLSNPETVEEALDRLAKLFHVSDADLQSRAAQKMKDAKSEFRSQNGVQQKTWICVNDVGEFYASSICEQRKVYDDAKKAGKTKRKPNDVLKAAKQSAAKQTFDVLDAEAQLAYMVNLKGLTPVVPGTLSKNMGHCRRVLTAMMKELQLDSSWCKSLCAPSLTASCKAAGAAVVTTRMQLGRRNWNLQPTVDLSISILQKGDCAEPGDTGAALKVLSGRRGIEIFHNSFKWTKIDSKTVQISSLAKKGSNSSTDDEDMVEGEERLQTGVPFNIVLPCEADLVLAAVQRVQSSGAHVKAHNASANAAFKIIMAPLAAAYREHFGGEMRGHQLRAVYSAYMLHLSPIVDDAQCLPFYMKVLGHSDLSSSQSYMLFKHVVSEEAIGDGRDGSGSEEEAVDLTDEGEVAEVATVGDDIDFDIHLAELKRDLIQSEINLELLRKRKRDAV
jgi:Telomere resolvase